MGFAHVAYLPQGEEEEPWLQQIGPKDNKTYWEQPDEIYVSSILMDKHLPVSST